MGLFSMSPQQANPFAQAQMQQDPALTQQVQMPQAAPQAPQQQANPYAYQRQKPSLWGILADGLSGAAGQPGQYGETLRKQGETQRLLAMQTMKLQQESAIAFAQHQRERDFDNHNQAPDALDRYIRQSGITDPEQIKSLYGQAAQQTASPFQMVEIKHPDGSVTREYVRPPAMDAGAPPARLDDLPPGVVPSSAGGQTQPASGTFR